MTLFKSSLSAVPAEELTLAFKLPRNHIGRPPLVRLLNKLLEDPYLKDLKPSGSYAHRNDWNGVCRTGFRRLLCGLW
jgi:hypothetical protein